MTIFSKIIPKLNEMGIQTYYILPVPEYEFHVPKTMYENTKNDKQFPSYNYVEYMNKNKNEIDAVSRLSEESGIKILLTPKIFCNPICEVSNSSGLFYFVFAISMFDVLAHSLIFGSVQHQHASSIYVLCLSAPLLSPNAIPSCVFLFSHLMCTSMCYLFGGLLIRC
jgi:hypothetical protein